MSRLKFSSGPHPSSQAGQAMVEYIVVTLAVVVVLLVATAEGSVVMQLNEAIRSFFRAYSFAISITPQGP